MMNEITASMNVGYALDAGRSRFTVQAFATGLLAGFGHNPLILIRDFAGEIRFDPEARVEPQLRMVVRASSLELMDNIRESDKLDIERTMQNEVLETSRFPEILFQSTSISTTRIIPGRWKAKIIGDLTLHGVTRHGLWIMAQVTLNDDELRTKGDFTLRQSDYGIKLVSVAAGTLKLQDELKFEFDLLGRRTEG